MGINELADVDQAAHGQVDQMPVEETSILHRDVDDGLILGFGRRRSHSRLPREEPVGKLDERGDSLGEIDRRGLASGLVLDGPAAEQEVVDGLLEGFRDHGHAVDHGAGRLADR